MSHEPIEVHYTCGCSYKGHLASKSCPTHPSHPSIPAPRPLPERLREIQERVEKATKGPWTIATGYRILCRKCGELTFVAVTAWNANTRTMEAQNNAEFIAHAREDIPYLLDALTDLSARVEQDLLAAFDLSVAGVHLLDGPRPSYEFYDKAEWHTRGIQQGLKIARVILVENLKLQASSERPRAGIDDGLLAAQARIAELEARILDLEATLQRRDGQ